MKTKISRIGKQSLSVILAIMMIFSTMLVGMVTANAYDISKSTTVYFDNSIAKWDSNSIYFRIGKGAYVSKYKMTKVSGTDNIYSYTLSEWGNYTGFTFANGIGGNNIDDWLWDKTDSNYASAHTWVYKFELNGGKYLFIPQSSDKANTSVSDQYVEPKSISCKGVTGDEIVYNSGTNAATTTKTVSVASVSNGTVTATYTSDGSTKTINEGSSANVLYGSTLKVSETPDDGFKANNATVTNANNTTSVTVANNGSCFVSGKDDTVVTGSFSALPKLADSVTLTADPVEVAKGKSVTLKATLDNKAAGLTGNVKYTFSEANGKACTINPSAVTNSSGSGSTAFSASSTGTYNIKVVASADGYKSVENTIQITVTNPSTVKVTAGTSNYGTVTLSGSAVTPVTGSDNEYNVKYNTSFNLIAQGKDGYVFKNWNTATGLSITAANSRSTPATATQDVTASATFSTTQCKLNSNIWVSSWSDSDTFNTTNADNTVSFSKEITKASTYSLDVICEGSYYKTGSITRSSNSATLTKVSGTGNDTSFTADVTGTYTFTFDTVSHKLTVTYPSLTKYTVTAGTLQSGASMTFSDGTTSTSEFLSGDTVHVMITPPEKYEVAAVTVSSGAAVTKNTNDWTFTMPAQNVTVNATFSKIDYTAKPSVRLAGTALTEDQMEIGKDIKLTATVTPAKDSDGNNVTGEYTVVFYKDNTQIGSNTVTVLDSSTTVASTYNTKLDELPAVYTAKAYPTAAASNISDASNEVNYVQKYPNKIYFDPSNNSTWRTDIQKVDNEFPTVTMTINSSSLSAEEKTYTMNIDPGFQFAKDKGVFEAKISNEALQAMQATGTTIKFSMTTTGGTTLSMTASGRSDIKDGSIMTMKYGSNSAPEYKWSDYNVSLEKTFPNKTYTTESGETKSIETYKDFTQYLAQNKTMNVVYFDNSATNWDNVYIYSWAKSGSNNAFDTSTTSNVSVAMKPLKNFDNIWYYEMPAGQTVPNGDFLFKDRSDAYDGTGAVFGYDYQQSVDLVEDYVIRGQSASDTNMSYEDMKFDNKYTLDAYDPTNAAAANLQNPIFITAQFASCTVRTQTGKVESENKSAYNYYTASSSNSSDYFGDGNRELKNRAFAYGWSDLYTNVVASTVKSKAVTIYFDIHDKVSQSGTNVDEMFLYHSVRNAYNYSGLPQFTKLLRLGSSTIYSATIQLPYNEEYSQLAFTFDSFKIGDNEYAMGADSQPAFKCINTGEVWYEIKNNIDTVGPVSTVSANSLSINSKAKAVDSAAVGAQVESDSVGAETTNTALLVPTTVKVNGSPINRVYVWYDDNGSQEPLGNWNESLLSSHDYKKVTIDNNEYYYIPFYCSATSFNFKYSSSAASNNETGNKTLASGKVWRNNQVNTDIGNGGTITTVEYTGAIPGLSVFTSVGLTGKINGVGDFNSESHELEYDPETKTWSITLEFTNGDNEFKARANDLWDISFGCNTNGDNYTKKLNGEYKISIADGADNKTPLTVEKVGSQGTPSLVLAPNSTNITLNKGMVTLSLNPTIANAPADTAITYSIAPDDTSKAWIDGNTFKASVAGTYVVTASITVDGETYSDTVTITVNEAAPITDVCGILAYEHARAEFSSTTGGIIDSGANIPCVMLTNGYYSADPYKTGYTVIDDNKYVTIYGLADSVKTDASASFNASTSKADASSNYQLAGWKKNGLTMADFVGQNAMTDKFPIYATTVSYLANWSEVVNIAWKFTYNWNRFDRSKNVWEFKWAGNDEWSFANDTVNNYKTDSITITVNLPDNYTEDEIIEEYYSYAPTVDDDYFGYTFRNSSYTFDESAHSVSTVATMSQPKAYKATVTYNDALTPVELKGYYQSALYLTDPTVVPDDKILVWVNDRTQNVLGTGNSLNLRLTNRDLIIHSELRDKATYEVKPYTTVSAPSYEAYYDTTKKENRVRMNFLVDNYTFGNKVTEYGVLYFFCEENGRPLDFTISQDYNISADKLIAAAQGNASGITRRKINNSTVNDQGKYFYQPTLALTDANKKRYLRMFSYFKYTDDNGAEQIVISDPDSIVIGTLSEFTPVF